MTRYVYCLFYSEGFGSSLMAIYTDRKTAEATAKKSGWYGGDLKVEEMPLNPESFITSSGKVMRRIVGE